MYYLRNTKNFITKLLNLSAKKVLRLLPNNGVVTLVDIGAAGEIEPRWKSFAGTLNYIGFEPDERSRNVIKNQPTDFLDYQILPYALGEAKETLVFNLCKIPQVSSFYEPNAKFLSRFPDAGRFEIVKKLNLQCVTLDSMKLRKIDFIKIDVQGAESKILKGAENSLKLAFGVELEVEFAELYSNQQLFGDVCTQLNSKGFEFIDFVNLTRWERGSHNGNGQCVFGDALFLKSPEFLNLQELCVNQIASYISILLIYRKFDLIEIALASLDEEKRLRFRLFEQALKGIKKRNVVIRMIVRILNTFISSLGSGYRLHLIQ